MITASDLFRVSLRQVVRQRTYGVVFSIALGITAFIALSVLGREIRYNIGQDMVLMGGVNIVQVMMDDARQTGQPLREFYPDTIEAVRQLPGVQMVSVSLWGWIQFGLRKGDTNLHTDFLPVDENYWETYAATLQAGRFLDSDDLRQRRRVTVIGRELAVELFETPENAVGQLLFLGNDIFEVVGVTGGVMLGSWMRSGFLPYTTALDRNWAGGKVNRLYVRAIAWEDVAKLKKSIPETVQAHQQAPYIILRTQDEQLERIQGTFVFVEALLWLGIVASLLLGGFGIWSGTFAAVRARTREVGLKKAMGGSDADVMAQFLTEALCKAVAGGVVGIVIGTLCVEAGAFFLHCQVSYTALAFSSVGSIVFSAALGILGGIYPALQASRMDVVTALRFE